MSASISEAGSLSAMYPTRSINLSIRKHPFNEQQHEPELQLSELVQHRLAPAISSSYPSPGCGHQGSNVDLSTMLFSQHSPATDMYTGGPIMVDDADQACFYGSEYATIAALQRIGLLSEFQQQEVQQQIDNPLIASIAAPASTLPPYKSSTFDPAQMFDSHDPYIGFYQTFSPLDCYSPAYPLPVHQEPNQAPEQDLSPVLSDETPQSLPEHQVVEEEEIMDKPYARLIYEALMQAPGHRLNLREIYEWFLQNTNKAQESGSNGWQNSIRHNLSMNQAFENDKTDSHSRSHSRKTNSVWVLTENAVRHGVQSTTRYRKPGVVRKGAGQRTPTIQRQRSGARGGRATRRSAVRAKKHDGQTMSRDEIHLPSDIMCFSRPNDMGIDESIVDQSPKHELVPMTPPSEDPLEMAYSLAGASPMFEIGQNTKGGCNYCARDALPPYEYLDPSYASPTFEEVTQVEVE